MKRDMDLVREILLKVEEAPGSLLGKALPETVAREAVEVDYHIKLMHEGGFIDAVYQPNPGRGSHGWNITGLTWSGHDFLDSVRNPDTWKKTKDGALLAGGWTMDILKDLAKGFIKKQIEERTGVKL